MKWEQNEIDFLLSNYNKGSRFCYNYLGRSKYSVLNKAKSLNIKFEKIEITEETRLNISNSLKKAHQEGRHSGWSFVNKDKNRRSYPEKFFIKVFENNIIFNNFIVEEKLSYGKYVIDFLLVELKLIEIDGQQHFRTEEAIEHDKIRDDYFLNEGFKIYRIKWSDICNNPILEINELIEFIKNIEKETIRKYDLIDIKKKNYKLCVCGNIIKTKNSISCNNCRIINNRKVKDRPSVNMLIEEVNNYGYSATGRKYNVSDKTIKKWIKSHLPTE